MNDNSDNQTKGSASIHFVNGSDQLTEFLANQSTNQNLTSSTNSGTQLKIDVSESDNQLNQLQSDQIDGLNDFHNQNLHSEPYETSPKTTITSTVVKDTVILNQPASYHNRELESSAFCTINSNGIENESEHSNSNSHKPANFVNKNAETYDKYEFAIPLPFR